MKTRRASEHTHRLVWVAQGSIVARDADRVYLLPRGHALWVPAGTRVSILAASGSDVGSTALHVTEPPARLATVASFELPASVLRLANGIPGSGPASDADRNVSTIVSRLETPAHHAMTIVLPSDPSLRHIAERILRDPCAPHTTKRHAVSVGVRATTLSSRFTHQTGLSLAQWRSRVRMYAAVVLLGQGISIGEVADSIGYCGPSDLSAAHKRVFGVTPMAFKRRGHRVRVDRATGSEPGLRGRSPAYPTDLLLPDPGRDTRPETTQAPVEGESTGAWTVTRG